MKAMENESSFYHELETNKVMHRSRLAEAVWSISHVDEDDRPQANYRESNFSWHDLKETLRQRRETPKESNMGATSLDAWTAPSQSIKLIFLSHSEEE